jgi:hypothetical protein
MASFAIAKPFFVVVLEYWLAVLVMASHAEPTHRSA